MFIYLVNVFNGMPGGKIVGIIFYICVLFAEMSSLVNLYEAPVATLQERFGLKRVSAVGIIAAFGCCIALLIQASSPDGWTQFLSISAHLEQCLQRSCSSGSQIKNSH